MSPNRLFSLLLFSAILFGCEDNTLPPNSNAIVSTLSTAKGECEQLAVQAQRQVMLPRRRAAGQARYETARTACNSFIREFIVATGPTSKGLSETEISLALRNIDAKCQAFENWYTKDPDGPTMAEAKETGAAIEAYNGPALGISDIVDLSTAIAELITAYKVADENERQTLRLQLEECKWREWSKVSEQTE